MIAHDQKVPTCKYHHDREAGDIHLKLCDECAQLDKAIFMYNLDEHSEILCKMLSAPRERLVWLLEHNRFSSTHPHLLKEAGLWQASYLLFHFGEDCLTGLAAYFSSLGDDLRERADRRDRATRLTVAERDQTLREMYPPERYQQKVNDEKLEDLL